MKVQTQIKAGRVTANHNQTLVRPAAIRMANHN
jgi:hypothetical protein